MLTEILDLVTEIEEEDASSEEKQTEITAPSSLIHTYIKLSTPAPSEIP